MNVSPMMPRRPDFDQAWAQVMANDNDEAEFLVENTRGVMLDGGGRTISSDALDRLRDELMLFVGSRLTRRLQTGKSAPRVRVKVSVSFE